MPNWKREIRERIAGLNLPAERELEIVEELSQHAEDRFEDLLSNGSSRENAFRISLSELTADHLLEWRRQSAEPATAPDQITPGSNSKINMFAGFRRDLQYAVRVLLKRPGLSAVVVLSLALGIGANTAIFSIVNAVLLRPLPFHNSQQLAIVYSSSSTGQRDFVSFPDLEDWRNQSHSFEELAGFVPQSVNLTGRDEPERVVGSFVTANFFKTLKVDAEAGRTFVGGEDDPGASPVVVVGHNTWRDRFGSDPQLIGKTLILNGQPFLVVGILPESFHFPIGDADVWMSLRFYPNFSEDRARASSAVIGRLKNGVTLARATSEMTTIASRLAEQFPDTNRNRGVLIRSAQDVVVEGIGPMLLVLLGSVGFMLLIGCANVANLTLARAAARQREFALRSALGASRIRLIRQLLTETLLLSLIGGALGLVFGAVGMRLLLAWSPANVPPGIVPGIDLTVLLFTVIVSILTGIFFGLAPALRFSRPDVNESLKDGGRGLASDVGPVRLRGLFVVAQVAVSMVLLVGGGLMLRSFLKLLNVSPGFNAQNVLTMEYRVPRQKYPQGEQQWAFHQRVVDRVSALPGVESASVVLALPYSGNGGEVGFVPLDRSEPPHGQEPKAQRNIASENYFHTMQIPLIAGRVFAVSDKAGSPPLAVINKTMSEQYWPGGDAVGRQLRLLGDDVSKRDQTVTIVGVVGDVKHYGLDEPSAPQIYLAYSQNPFIFATLVVRASTPLSIATSVRKAVWSVDKDQPVWKVRTLEALMDTSIGPRRFVMLMLVGFSAFALLLASFGLYGVMSHMTINRTHEIGVRIALGAQTSDVIKLVLKHGLALVAVGIVAGIAAAFLLTRLMANLLFDVAPTDPATFAAVSLVLTLVALVACYLPARRASHVDPMVALRFE